MRVHLTICLFKLDLGKIRLEPKQTGHKCCGRQGVFVVVYCVGHSVEYWLVTTERYGFFFLFPSVLYVWMIY